jgi:hypothetical protein
VCQGRGEGEERGGSFSYHVLVLFPSAPREKKKTNKKKKMKGRVACGLIVTYGALVCGGGRSYLRRPMSSLIQRRLA